MVTVYTQPGCGPCMVTERWLDKYKVEYTTHNIRENPAAAAAVREMDYDGTPVVVTADGRHWKGFQPSMLATLTEGSLVY